MCVRVSSYTDSLGMLDVACAQAAGCELAIADATFSITRDSASGIGVMAALLHIHKRAQREFPRGPVALGLVALMDFQYARAITPKIAGAGVLPLTITRGCCRPASSHDDVS